MNKETYNKNKELLDKIEKELSTMDTVDICEILASITEDSKEHFAIILYCRMELAHREFIAENN
jgi:chorismate mutase